MIEVFGFILGVGIACLIVNKTLQNVQNKRRSSEKQFEMIMDSLDQKAKREDTFVRSWRDK